MKNRCRWCALGLGLFVLAGCGEGGFRQRPSTRSPSAGDAESISAMQASPAKTAAAATVAEVGEHAAGQVAAEGVVRKIVYKADVDLVCDDFAAVAERIEGLATSAGGFVADAQLVGASGEPRWGVWKLRVPAGRFDELLAEVKKLAEVRSARTTADDVSEEYYDVEARIRNKQQEETRLLRLLDDRTAKLEEVLSVEREISRVRGEVEQLQARLRVLTDLTDLATITIRVQEVQGYHPETAATFGLRLTRSVQQSFDSLISALQAVIIAFAFALPWIVTLLVPMITAVVLSRRWRMRALK